MFRWLLVPIGKDLAASQGATSEQAAALTLSVGLACFVLPYVLFAAPAGYLADKLSKRRVIVACKAAEVVIMILGLLSIWLGNVYALFTVLFFMGTQSALFGPAKLGSLPELVHPEKLSAANGLMNMVTMLAVVGGAGCGGVIYQFTTDSQTTRLWVAGGALIGVAVAGWCTSLLIRFEPAADPHRKFPWNLFSNTWADLRLMSVERPLLRAALGSAFFWSLASLSQLNIDALVVNELHMDQVNVSTALVVLTLGVGLGSVLAGWLSGDRVELGLTPLGALGIVFSSVMLFVAVKWYALWLFTLGISAGLYDVPLSAFLQHRSPPESRGSILAALNFLVFLGMLLVSGLFYVLHGQMHLKPTTIFLLSGLATIPVLLYILFLLPYATMRFLVWLVSHTMYKVRVYDRQYLPERGGALLACNHVSWLDAIFLMMTSSRPIRMFAFADHVEAWPVRWLTRRLRVIPVKMSPKSIRASLDTARQSILDGELVCIFPEGALTRTGQMGTFQRGMMKIVEGTGAPVVPVYLHGLWGSIFSFRGGKFFWKRPRQWPYPVTIVFGPHLQDPENPHQVRQAVQKLGVIAMDEQKKYLPLLPRTFLRTARRYMFTTKAVDSLGQECTGGQLLLRSLILARLLRKVIAADEKHIGVLLPPSVGGVVVNATVSLLRRVSVNLNYSATADVINNCIAQADIKHILTTRKMMEKLDLKLNAEVVYLDDLKEKVSLADKLIAALQTYSVPSFILERILGLTKLKPDDVMTIIFTSGSTGDPKGVMLSYANIGSNVLAVEQVADLKPKDALLGILPFFHSFGYTVTLWTALSLDPKGVYHFSPLDAKQIGKLCQKYKVTIMLTTPTFLRSYLRRCEKEEFAHLELVIVGAEKLPAELAQAFHEKYGVMPQEGYGATELSPLVSVNIPDYRSPSYVQIGSKPGTVGRPVPNVAAKVIDPDTGAELGPNQPGKLLITGPNVMLGYLNKPEATAEKMQDGWYLTGDIALIDSDGFIQITGRESRFSKIGGEMVPHLRIEELINEQLGTPDELLAVVTAVPDERKGERLIVLHTTLSKTPDEICRALASAGLPNLWIPSLDSFCEIPTIPLLGSGKLALAEIRTLALEKFAPAEAK